MDRHCQNTHLPAQWQAAEGSWLDSDRLCVFAGLTESFVCCWLCRLVGGFGLCGIPTTVINAVRDSGIKGNPVTTQHSTEPDSYAAALANQTRV